MICELSNKEIIYVHTILREENILFATEKAFLCQGMLIDEEIIQIVKLVQFLLRFDVWSKNDHWSISQCVRRKYKLYCRVTNRIR